jgi:hypothetical protein
MSRLAREAGTASLLHESETGAITMAFSGDCMITRALTPFREDRFLRLRDVLHSADVRFTNGEMLFHDYEDAPADLLGLRCDPCFLEDVQWLGINLVSCANTHAYGFGENGILTNIPNLDATGMVHAGTGRNYAEAVSPAYLDTSKGRRACIGSFQCTILLTCG